ncbi:MAG: hypothetical protein ACSHW2_03550 [Parasphingopyxis sp.]
MPDTTEKRSLASMLAVAGGLALAAPALQACSCAAGCCAAIAEVGSGCCAAAGDTHNGGCCAAAAEGCCAATAEATAEGCCAAH